MVKATADPLQHTVSFNLSERLMWRKILLWRYYEDLGNRDEFHVEWSDYNQHSKIVTINEESDSNLSEKMEEKDLFKTIDETDTKREPLASF